jgi:hypothetical protein
MRPQGGRVHQQRVQRIVLLHSGPYPGPHARGHPALDAHVRRVPVAPRRRQSSPPTAVAREPQHRFHKPAVVLPPAAFRAFSARQQQRNPRPLRVSQQMLHAQILSLLLTLPRQFATLVPVGLGVSSLPPAARFKLAPALALDHASLSAVERLVVSEDLLGCTIAARTPRR